MKRKGVKERVKGGRFIFISTLAASVSRVLNMLDRIGEPASSKAAAAAEAADSDSYSR